MSWRTRSWVWRRRGSRRTPPGRGTGVRTPRGARDRARRRGPSARDGRRRGRGAGRGPRGRARRWRRSSRRAEPTGANPDDARGAPTRGIARARNARPPMWTPTRCASGGTPSANTPDAHGATVPNARARARRPSSPRRASTSGIRAGAARFSAADDARRARLRRPPLRACRPTASHTLIFEPPGSAIGRRVDDVHTERDHARRPPERVAIDAVRHVRRIARSIPASEADTRPIAFGRSDRALHARKGTLRR